MTDVMSSAPLVKTGDYSVLARASSSGAAALAERCQELKIDRNEEDCRNYKIQTSIGQKILDIYWIFIGYLLDISNYIGCIGKDRLLPNADLFYSGSLANTGGMNMLYDFVIYIHLIIKCFINRSIRTFQIIQ